MINAIVCVDKNFAIGKDNKLLFYLPRDLNFFKNHTKNSIVLVGRKTLESFPESKPLKGRSTICLCSRENKRDDCYCVHSFEEALSLIIELSKTQEIWILGGQSVYEKFIDICDRVWVTKVDADGDGDSFFPNLDKRTDFKCLWESEAEQDNGYTIKFCEYGRIY